MATDVEILERAKAALSQAKWAPLQPSTNAEYRRIAARVERAREQAGITWLGVDSLGGAQSTKASRRAAWSRYAHVQVAQALHDYREKRFALPELLERLRVWVPEAESVPPHPDHVVIPGPRQAEQKRPARKRDGLKDLPEDWLDRLWQAAVDRSYRHLDALALLIVTGARSAEVCRGVAVCVSADQVTVALAGAKVTPENGQPWRRLVVAREGAPADHVASLAPGGKSTWLQPDVSPAALSMGVADLGEAASLPRRVSAYDIRHQRASDARHAFNGDMDALAAWLGHSATSTARHYGRLPRAAGCRGARPIAAAAPREIRHRLTAALKDECRQVR